MKLPRARQLAALLFFGGMTLLFLAPTREVTQALSWMARLQLLPAVLALSGLTVLFVAVLTLLFGRLYCSVICPLGVMQDLVSWVRERFSKKARFRYGYTPERKSVRYPVLVLFVLALAGGAGSVAMLIAPYGAYGRIAQNLFAPVWIAGNNVLAALCARLDSFAVLHRDLWVRSSAVLAIAAVTFAVLAVLAWRKGRSWCNTVCPTCSCFETVDYLNQENSRKGERRRIWSSCMLPDFSRTAGGNIARKFPRQMMRYKTLHKVYDYNKRFGGNEHMCVGCGRCLQRCPEEISFVDTINRLSEETDRLKGREAERTGGSYGK